LGKLTKSLNYTNNPAEVLKKSSSQILKDIKPDNNSFKSCQLQLISLENLPDTNRNFIHS